MKTEGFDGEFFKLNNPLVCVVTGMEHSGTTMLSQLLNGHPRIASGVECGLLLSNIYDFGDVQPFYDWMTRDNWGWGITPADRSRIMTCQTFEEAYWVLNQCKGRANPNPAIRKVFLESDLIYDKTPRYIYSLDDVMSKVSRPFVVTLKSPVDQFSSQKKRGKDMKHFMARYSLIIEKIAASQKAFEGRLLVVKYEDLATQTDRVMSRVASFVGLNGSEPLSMEQYNLRFGHLVESRNSFDRSKTSYRPKSDNVTAHERRDLELFWQDLPRIDAEDFGDLPA